MKHIYLKYLTVFILISMTMVVGTSALPLEDKIVILDPGHHTGSNGYQGYDEGAYMLDLAYTIKPLLEAQGATVHLTREDTHPVLLGYRVGLVYRLTLDAYIEAKEEEKRAASTLELDQLSIEIEDATSLLHIADKLMYETEDYREIYTNTPFSLEEERVIHPDTARIFEIQADPIVADKFIFISLHSNATGKPIDNTINGADVFYTGNTIYPVYYDNYATTAKNRYFANLVLGNLNQIGIASNEVQEYLFYVNREMNIPSVLVENGFHTSKKDRDLFQSKGFMDKMASGYEKAIMTYFQEVPYYIGEYTDIFQEKWYTDSITYVLKNNLFAGTTATTFEPNAEMTRGMLVAVLERMEHPATVDNQRKASLDDRIFIDITSDAWYYKVFLWAENYDLFEGTDIGVDGLAQPNLVITREEAAQIIYQFLKIDAENSNVLDKDVSVDGETDVTEKPPQFLDFDTIAPENQEAVEVLFQLGIVSGSPEGNYLPKTALTRAETSVLIQKLDLILNG